MTVEERLSVLESQLLKLTELAVAALNPEERDAILLEADRIKELLDSGRLTTPRAYPDRPARPRRKGSRR
jgi:hypothetical protein